MLLALFGALAALPAAAADAAHPAVVELFQSQGCSSCPPANAHVLALADRPDVLTLSWQVTYWDQLGWTDTFGTRAFTARQYDYARGLGHDGVYTPQVVVNGRADGSGLGAGEVEALLARADRGAGGPRLTLSPDAVAVGAGQASGDVLLVRYDPRILRVPILRGENGGATLAHRNVVREVIRLGAWAGRPVSYTLPAATRPGLRSAILVQAGPGGPILAATRG